MEIHRSARRHGISDDAIEHSIRNAVVVVDLEPDADPPRVLAVGPDLAGNLLEVVVLDLPDADLVIHAMPLRSTFRPLLPGEGETHG